MKKTLKLDPLKKDPLKYVRANIKALVPYSTARDEFKGGDISVWLDANESPYNNGINRYPDPHQRQLKEQIAMLKGVDPDMIFIGGAGSDEAIDLTYRIFCEPGRDNAVAISPSYGVYEVAARINDVEYRQVALAADYQLDIEALLAATDANTRLIWICSPNNPTGNAFDVAQILELAERFDGIVAVDEAYVDFSEKGSMLAEIADHSNVVVLQTFSKAWGMASLRAGMAFATPAIARLYGMVKYPYNMNGPTQQRLCREIQRDIAPQVEQIKQERRWLESELRKRPEVIRIHPSDANFLLVEVTDPDAIYSRLIDQGIIVRNRTRVAGCEGTLRITVGTPDENRRLAAALGCPTDDSVDTDHRKALITRTTSETDITVYVDLDQSGISTISTGLHFFDHMLNQLPHHGGFTLNLSCHGDLEVDEHHTIEDVALALGAALDKALGNKRGIERYGFALPMDESHATVLLDLGGRPDLQWDVTFTREYVGDTPTEMLRHFFQSLAVALRANIRVEASGDNNHHLAEAIFKGLARALRAAIHRNRMSDDLPSSKGVL